MLLSITLLTLLFVNAMADSLDETHSDIVQSKSGPIVGTVSQSADGNEVNVFYGIPYAEPPVGNLRFKPPKMVKRWTSVLQAVKPSLICYQTVPSGFLNKHISSTVPRPWSEDCLTLNIWSPRPKPEKVPVIFYIHGGAFSLGSGTTNVDGTALANEGNVIVVTINYRLGVFGFFTLGTTEAPGNVALMDQNLALQWVKENIAVFGGDPEAITIMGASAGSMSVGYHLLSPKSRGLFQKGIMMSGTPINFWTEGQERTTENSRNLMNTLGCQLPDATVSLQCIQNRHPEDILDAVRDDDFLNLKFMPTVDGEFLTEHPSVSVESGRFNPADVFIGGTKDEGSVFLLASTPDTFDTMDGRLFRRDFTKVIKRYMKELSDLQCKALDVTYTDWSNPDDPLMLRDAAKHIFGDALFNCGINELADKLSQTEAAVYRYVYAYEAAVSVSPLPKWIGVTHGQDHFPVVGPTQLLKMFPPPDAEAAKRLRRHILNFVNKGDPNIRDSGYPEDPEWPRYDGNRNYLHFAKDSSVLSNFRLKECNTWSKLMPLLQDKKC